MERDVRMHNLWRSRRWISMYQIVDVHKANLEVMQIIWQWPVSTTVIIGCFCFKAAMRSRFLRPARCFFTPNHLQNKGLSLERTNVMLSNGKIIIIITWGEKTLKHVGYFRKKFDRIAWNFGAQVYWTSCFQIAWYGMRLSSRDRNGLKEIEMSLEREKLKLFCS